LKEFDETLGGTIVTRVTITFWNTAVITRLFLGGSPVSKSPPEWEEQLGDCAELDDKTS